jgi:hypothetical protein
MKLSRQSQAELTTKVYNMKDLRKEIAKIESLIMVYSDRDLVRVEQLQAELNALNMQLLDQITEQNVSWLKEQMIRIEA